MKYLRRSLSVLLTISILLTMMITTAVQSAALDTNDDYRTWSHHDSRWSGTTMGSSTLGNGGAPTTAITKLAIQAGLRDAHDFNVGDMSTLLSANNGYSGSAIVWSAPTKASLNLFSSYNVLKQSSDSTPSFNSASNYSTLIGYINQGYHLIIQVVNSSGTSNYVAVDEKLTLTSGSVVYIMDCLSNAANNTNIALAKRYSTFTRVIGYKGEASQSSTVNSDYRKWELNNTNWASTALGSSTMNNSNVGGGDLVLASTKLAIQAGLWSENTQSGNNSVNRAVSAIQNYTSGGVVGDWEDIKTAFGFQSYNNALMGSSENLTATMDTSLSANVTNIINYLNEGYYLVIRVNSSVGWVAVDTDKTLSTGEIYIMRSTPDASKNAEIKLSDYYDKINRVAGFKVEGVQVNFSGKADFTAEYTKEGNTSSFKSGGFVPDGAVVTITAEPKQGYTAANNWTISGGYSGTSTEDTFTFTADRSTSATANIEYTPSPKNYNITYNYGTNAASFTYTTIPGGATTGAAVNMEISPKTDGSFVYELKIAVKDSDNNEIPVTHNGTHYSFTMPASDVTVTFTGENVSDWRRWARDDERWRDKAMTSNGHTVQSDGAVMISLAKLAVQAGLHTPTTSSTQGWDVNDVVDALKAEGKIQNSDAQLVFDNTSATALGFTSLNKFKDTNTNSSTRGDIKNGYGDTIVAQLKQGYHQIIRLHRDGSTFTTANSEWFVIDEEKTLFAVGDTTTDIPLSSIYIFRATADANKNANYTLQDLYDATGGDSNGGYRYVWRNYAFLGGTTPARKINFTIKTNDVENTDAHKGSVAAEYIINGESTSFVSGDYVPANLSFEPDRTKIKLKYNADPGYFAFENWTTPHTSPTTTLAATETANPKEFTVAPSDFRTSETVANISCNITPEEYHIYYEDSPVNFSYSNKTSVAGYNTDAVFTINPASGYTVDESSIVFKDADDNVISGLTASKSNRTYTFTMPAQDVYISATATTQTYDDFRAWGVNDSRWNTKVLRGTKKMGDAVADGGDAIMAFAKLLIQSGMPTNLKNAVGEYNAKDSNTNSVMMNSIITRAIQMVNGSYIINTNGVLNSVNNSSTSNSGQWGMGYMAANLSITGTAKYGGVNTSGATYYDPATANDTYSQSFMYPLMLTSGSYSVSSYKELIKDYLAGSYTVNSGIGTNIQNTKSYKFHIMLYVNDTIGWVAVDEAQTLNTGEIWVWASHGINGTNNSTSQDNIFKLSDVSSTFVRAAGFKFSNTYNLYGSDTAEFTTSNAVLQGSYSYLGQDYGPYSSVMYVPHGATVNVTRTGISDHYTPSDSETYGAWNSAGGTVTPVSYSKTNIVYDTDYQGAASARHTYDVQYVVKAVPQVHVKFVGDEHGIINATSAPISGIVDVYQGDTVNFTVTPDANYEVDTLKIIKTDMNFGVLSPPVEEGLDPDETSVTFDSDRTGGEESWFIIQATFKGHSLRITYNYQEYDPSKSGTFEYIEGDTFDEYLTDKTYTISLDSYNADDANAINAQVAAHAPVLQNVYFNYTLDLETISSNTEDSVHTAEVTMTPIEKPYTISVNGKQIDGVFHYQEEVDLQASDFDVDSEDVVWRSGAESGKSGSAVVCYDTIYSFRVTNDLNLTVDDNLTSRNSVDGTSAIVPGYTELKRVNNVEKCVQNFYVQDFFDKEAPRVYDDSGNEIEDAENITFLGAGVLFYSYDTDANKPKKTAFDGVEPTRETVNSVLENNKNAFLTEATGQGSSFKNSNLNYSYIKASTDNGNILRYSPVTNSYNYFFSAAVTNDRTPEEQKYVFRVYSFYVCSYTLNGNTYVTPVLSGHYAQAKVYSISE